MKYIIFEDFAGESTPIIFPERIDFEEMREQIPYSRVLSAGKVVITSGRLQCSGRSSELGVKARDTDSMIIARYFSDNT